MHYTCLQTHAQVLEAERKQHSSAHTGVLNGNSSHSNDGANDERTDVAISSASSLSPIGGRVCADTTQHNGSSTSGAFTLTDDAFVRPKEGSLNNHCCG